MFSIASSRKLSLGLYKRTLTSCFSSASSSVFKSPVEVFINGNPITVESGSAVIQACEIAGVDIPRFCYHERLAIAGNCRMCLVEVEKVAKPVASCAMPVTPGMRIKTDTPLVKKAREGVMEFLLANHPLDCPICDQGGECDLQDQSVRYGSDRSRFNESAGKRATENKNFGPLVKTVMTRCIHCTRCVRFANDVAGALELGTSGRGNDMQIGTYVEKTLNSEMSGNLVDLCPVGALTSKPYAFTTRPWELKKTESIDVMDAIGSNIRIDTRGLEVMRVLPRVNEDVNEEWISDKTRFAYDGLKTQRLTHPMIKQNGSFISADWPEALNLIAEKIKNASPNEITGVAGQLADAESLVSLKDFLNKIGSQNLFIENLMETKLEPGTFNSRSNYTMNGGITSVEEADVILLVGTNPRHEAPTLNSRIRKSYLYNNLDIGVIGKLPNLNYEAEHIGESPLDIEKLLKGKHSFFKQLSAAKKPMIIVGSSIFERSDASGVLSLISKLAEKLSKTALPGWSVYNVLQRAASTTAALDLGYSKTNPSTTPKVIYLLNADEIKPSQIPKDAFVVYQGHHGDNGAQFADVILPGAAYTEKSATYVNTEGRSQMTRAAVTPPLAAKEDWKIIRALSEVSGFPLSFENVSDVRQRMGELVPALTQYDCVNFVSDEVVKSGLAVLQSTKGKVSSEPFELAIKDFYLTDPISRASVTMAKCSKAYTKGEVEVESQEGVIVHQST